MSYTPTEWNTGDTITAEKLNNMEQGIASAGGGGAFLVGIDIQTQTLDKTWQEIHDALASGQDARVFAVIEGMGVMSMTITGAMVEDGEYAVTVLTTQYTTNSPNGYPVRGG